MSKVLSNQLVNGSASTAQRRKIVSALWIVQGLLALLFLFAGSTKLAMPIDKLVALMSLPGPFLKFIGVAEVAGAIGLILPGLLRIRVGLTPLAACGLVIIMVGATIYTVLSGNIVSALMPLMVGLLCSFVAYGRRTSLTADPILGRFFRRYKSVTVNF